MKKRSYWSRDIANMLGIGTSTLRKYCLLLEEKGYVFLRDDNGRRAFTEHDAVALRKLRDLTDNRGMSLDNAAMIVKETMNRGNDDDGKTLSATSDTSGLKRPNERHNEVMDKLNSVIEKQETLEAFNKTLLDRLDKQQEYIENSLNKRDELLMKALREELETQKQIATASEEKQGFWSRLFGKK